MMRSNLIIHYFICIYKTKKIFYSEKIYAFSKSLLLFKIIACQSEIVF